MFFIDNKKAAADDDDDDSFEATQKTSPLKAAWFDEDDSKVYVDITAKNRLKKLRQTEAEDGRLRGDEYTRRLREFNEKIAPRPLWAQQQVIPDSEDEDELPAILQRPFEMVEKRPRHLLPDVLEIKRLNDANVAGTSSAAIRTVKFHPTGMLLVGGDDRSIRIFDIDGRENALLHTARLRDASIRDASFTAEGQQVVLLGSGKPIIYRWNMVADRMERVLGVRGSLQEVSSWNRICTNPSTSHLAISSNDDSGAIYIFNGRSLQHLHTIRMNGPVKSMTFSPDGRFLFTAGHDHRIFQWDCLAGWSCLQSWEHQTGTVIGSLSISPDQSYLTAASNMGIVSLWDYQQILNQSPSPQPIKSLLNLTTFISSSTFHPSSQLYAYSSDEIRNALRMVHLPSGRVYSNWPTLSTPLGHLQSMDFSPDGRYFVAGNRKGSALLYSLPYFDQ